MGNRNHRPFAGLTWAQLTTLRSVHQRHHFDNYDKRALWALSKKRVPLLVKITDGHTTHYVLTDEGHAVWQKMKEWRTDLFKENRC